MRRVTSKEYVMLREGLLLPDRPPARGLSRINPIPTTNSHRRRLHPRPAKPPEPFPPTITAVAAHVPRRMTAKWEPPGLSLA